MAPKTALHLCITIIVALTSNTVLGFTPGSAGETSRKSDSRFMPASPPPSSQADSTTCQNMLRSFGAEQERLTNTRLSNSVLASCDTLPSFKTAHGILSPETVSRMDEITDGGDGNPAVTKFLSVYRRNGPMSCLEMLSDPEVLPHLTRAMRDIV
eukprot:scaffold1391_cov123-Cylindrotheca_fusiformis.AAC.10